MNDRMKRGFEYGIMGLVCFAALLPVILTNQAFMKGFGEEVPYQSARNLYNTMPFYQFLFSYVATPSNDVTVYRPLGRLLYVIFIKHPIAAVILHWSALFATAMLLYAYGKKYSGAYIAGLCAFLYCCHDYCRQDVEYGGTSLYRGDYTSAIMALLTILVFVLHYRHTPWVFLIAVLFKESGLALYPLCLIQAGKNYRYSIATTVILVLYMGLRFCVLGNEAAHYYTEKYTIALGFLTYEPNGAPSVPFMLLLNAYIHNITLNALQIFMPLWTTNGKLFVTNMAYFSLQFPMILLTILLSFEALGTLPYTKLWHECRHALLCLGFIAVYAVIHYPVFRYRILMPSLLIWLALLCIASKYAGNYKIAVLLTFLTFYTYIYLLYDRTNFF